MSQPVHPVVIDRRSLLLTLFAQLPTFPRPQDQDYVVRMNADLVVLDIAVETRQGRTIAGLLRENFTVYEDGRPQVVKQFSSAETPACIGLVLDMSLSMLQRVASLRNAVNAFLEASNTRDEYFVVGFNDKPRLALAKGAAFASDRGVVRAAVNSLQPEGMTSLYDALVLALAHTRHSTMERRVLVVVSDGADTASHTKLGEVLRQTRSNPVTIYTVGLFEGDDPDQNRGVLKQLARISGGRYYNPLHPVDIQRDCLQMAREIRARYTLAYTPAADPKSGVIRKIRVQVTNPADREKYVVKTRTEITLAGPAKTAAMLVTRR